MPSRAPPEMHTNVMHDNAIAFMIHHCREADEVAASLFSRPTQCRSLYGTSLSAASVICLVRRRDGRRLAVCRLAAEATAGLAIMRRS